MSEPSLREQVAALRTDTKEPSLTTWKLGYYAAIRDVLALITPAHEAGPEYEKALEYVAQRSQEYSVKRTAMDALDAAKGQAAPPPVAIEPHFYSMNEHSEIPGQWHAERVGKDGEVYVVIFSGPDAEVRCAAFVDWQRGQAAPEKG